MKKLGILFKQFITRLRQPLHRLNQLRAQLGTRKIMSGLAAIPLALIAILVFNIATANADVTSIRPNGDGTRNNWTNTSGGTTNLYSHVDDDPDSPNDADYIQGPTNVSPSSFFLALENTPANFESASSIEIKARHQENGSGNDDGLVSYQIVAADETTSITDVTASTTLTQGSWTTTTYTPSITGTNTKASWDGARIKITQTKTQNQGPDNVQVWVSAIEVNITYTPGTTFEQSSYRFFANTDTTDVGSALAAQDTPATLSSYQQEFRLRANLHGSVANLAQSGKNFGLQIAGKGAGTCAAPSGTPSSYQLLGELADTWVQKTDAPGFSPGIGAGYAAFNGKIWQIGGYNAGQLDDVWSSEDGETWELVTNAPGWSPRNYAQVGVLGNTMYLMGGFNGSTYEDDVWSTTDGETWTQETGAAGWSGRVEFGATVYDNKLWVMGGWNGSARLNDVWYSSNGSSWTQATSNAAWSIRNAMAAGVVNGKMLIMGGFNGSAITNQVYSSTDGSSWTLETTPSWSARGAAAAVSYNNRLYLMGGWNFSSTYYNDIYYTDTGSSWTQLTGSAEWAGRKDFSVTANSNGLYVYAGETTGASNLDDVWNLSATAIGWNDNPTPADGAALTSNANDPTHNSDTIRKQTYVESNGFTNSQSAINIGEDGMWDFSLKDMNAPPATTYCLRITNSAGDPISTYTQYAEITTAPSNLSQSAYRWFNNDASPAGFSYTSTLSNADFPYDVKVDKSAGYIYVAGLDQTISSTDARWRIEKRRASDGALCTAANCGTEFGTGGVAASNGTSGNEWPYQIALDPVNGYLYLAGFDTTGTNQIRVEKRRMDTGALCTAANCGTEFGTGGVITNNVSANSDIFYAVDIDIPNGYIYLAGQDESPGLNNLQMRIEKRRVSDGALCSAANCGTQFGTNGVITSNPTSGRDFVKDMALDLSGGYIFAVGEQGTNAGDWRIEKRRMDTGALCTAANCGTEFGTGGAYTFTGGSGEDIANGVTLDSGNNYLYVAGQDTILGASNGQWRIAKFKMDTGALCTAANCGTEFGTNGVVQANFGSGNELAHQIELDHTGSYIFTTGEDAGSGNIGARTEKRRADTGVLCTAANCGTEFGTSGYLYQDPTSSTDPSLAIELDSESGMFYRAGFTTNPNQQWQIEKRSMADASVPSGTAPTTLAATNTPTTLTQAGQDLRLRIALYLQSAPISISGQEFKLQYVGKGAGTCASPSGGTPSTYTDVTTATAIAYHDTSGFSDNSPLISAGANDPNSGQTITRQTYEEANIFTNSIASVNAGEEAVWEFSLKDNNATPGTTYCLRTINNSEDPLTAYTNYAEITVYNSIEPTPTPTPTPQPATRTIQGGSVIRGGVIIN